MTGRTPPAVFNSSPAPIDQDWVDAELIPFLQRVYPEERRTTMDWNRQVVFGRSNLHLLVSNPDANLPPSVDPRAHIVSPPSHTTAGKYVKCTWDTQQPRRHLLITDTDAYTPGTLRRLPVHNRTSPPLPPQLGTLDTGGNVEVHFRHRARQPVLSPYLCPPRHRPRIVHALLLRRQPESGVPSSRPY